MSTVALWRDKLAYQPASLAIVALLASAALAFGNHATRDDILRAEERDLQASLSQVLPEGYADNDLLGDTMKIADGDGKPVTLYRARKAGVVNGAVFQASSRGYAGDIVVLIGVDAAGRMLGARVVKHVETPGLGDKIEIAKAKWIRGFDGKSLGDPTPEKWAVKKDGGVFDQFAGATITPRAVVKAVKGGLEFFAAHRDEILNGG
ncbi:MAG: electron transport complex subunit RsxG [Candidatus Nitricoxidivorans perseverans]|uniref:Ion-translocating oxidoreductase complex subunit G n=1 Tax=Candidatus Nitricoxidivorans perseverans TaxID=2975601 RepID=A0AA49FM03_9PROT|nr:MAG: electron transport complex subunit RsxG [Candidatus Nitricoxidivorans perseverans]